MNQESGWHVHGEVLSNQNGHQISTCGPAWTLVSSRGCHHLCLKQRQPQESGKQHPDTKHETAYMPISWGG